MSYWAGLGQRQTGIMATKNLPHIVPHIVIVGAGYAGLSAARELTRRQVEARLTVIDPHAEYAERVRFHQVAAGAAPTTYPLSDALVGLGARFCQGHMTALDADGKQVEIAVNGTRERLSYDHLILALGSRGARAAIPGAGAHMFSLDDIDEARACGRAMKRLAAGGRVLIVGAGLTGLETATECAECFPALDMTLVDAGRLGRELSPAGAAHVRAWLEAHGIHILEDTRVCTITPGQAMTDRDAALPFDLCLWSAGFTVPDLVRNAGLAVTPQGQIQVDDRLRSPSHAGVLAAGDLAAATCAAGRPLRQACATAMPLGRQAAVTLMADITGQEAPAFDFSYRCRCISLGRADGLIQFVDSADQPLDLIWTGDKAARFKDYICRGTLADMGFIRDAGPAPFAFPDLVSSA